MASKLAPTRYGSLGGARRLPGYEEDTIAFRTYRQLKFIPKYVSSYRLRPVFNVERSNRLLAAYRSLPGESRVARLTAISDALLAYHRNTDAMYERAVLFEELGYGEDALKELRRWQAADAAAREPHGSLPVFDRISRCGRTHVTLVASGGETEKRFPIGHVARAMGVKASCIRRLVAVAALLIGLNTARAGNPAEADRPVLVEERPDATGAPWGSGQPDDPEKGTLYDSTGVPDSEWQNQFQKPDVNYKYLGKKQYEYYGSGDVNNNGVPGELADAQAIRDGTANDMADVNADGVVDTADVRLIEGYANGTGQLIGIDYMSPEFTKEQRVKWIADLFRNVYIPSFGDQAVINAFGDLIIKIPYFLCGDYEEQAIHDFQGWTNPEAFIAKYWSGPKVDNFRYTYNGRFNIQAADGGQQTESGNGHAVIRFPVGEDLTKEESWLSIDAQTGYDAGLETNFMKADQTIYTEWIGCSQTWGPIRGPPIIDWYVSPTWETSITWQNPDYKFTRPQNQAPVIESNLTEEQKNVEYQKGLTNAELFPEDPTVTDDSDPNPTVEYSYQSTQQESGVEKYRYSVTKTTTATDNEGAAGTLEEIVSVDDTTLPELGVSSTYTQIAQSDDPVKAAKALINYTYDNGDVVDTLVTHTSGNYYDLQVKDGVGNLSNSIQVEVDKSDGIKDIEETNKQIDLEVQNPMTTSSPYLNIATKNSGATKLEVYDMAGRKLEEKVFNTSYGNNVRHFRFNGLGNGLYLFRVTGPQGNADMKLVARVSR